MLTWSSHEALCEVVETLRGELSRHDNGLCFSLGDQVITNIFNNKQQAFCKWLEGKWLESLALRAFLDINATNEVWPQLHDCATSVELELQTDREHTTHFELDVVAVQGYRLFACSCSADSNKGNLKTKLFEVYHRAHQIGGDEARVALVCCSGNPQAVEDEAQRDLDVQAKIKPVKVFGRQHLSELGRHVKDWIQNA
ncbi:MAG: Card1-like endonuclease domain-containing protein [bacterium]